MSGAKRNRELPLMYIKVFFRSDEMFYNHTVVTVAQLWEHSKSN